MSTNDQWRKSTYSQGASNDCVELAVEPTTASVRDTKARLAGTLTFDTTEFSSFVTAVKFGHLNGS